MYDVREQSIRCCECIDVSITVYANTYGAVCSQYYQTFPMASNSILYACWVHIAVQTEQHVSTHIIFSTFPHWKHARGANDVVSFYHNRSYHFQFHSATAGNLMRWNKSNKFSMSKRKMCWYTTFRARNLAAFGNHCAYRAWVKQSFSLLNVHVLSNRSLFLSLSISPAKIEKSTLAAVLSFAPLSRARLFFTRRASDCVYLNIAGNLSTDAVSFCRLNRWSHTEARTRATAKVETHTTQKLLTNIQLALNVSRF